MAIVAAVQLPDTFPLLPLLSPQLPTPSSTQLDLSDAALIARYLHTATSLPRRPSITGNILALTSLSTLPALLRWNIVK